MPTLMGLCGQLSWSPLWCFITTCHGSPAAGGIHSSPPPVLQSWPPLSKVLSGLSWLSRVRLPRLRVLPPYRRGPCEDGVPLQEDGMQVSAASAVRPKGSWPRRPPRTPGKPLPRTPALSPLSEFHNPAGLAGKGGSGSCRFICTWIIGHWDFVRAVRHPNCPGASGFGAGETRGGGWGGRCQGHMWSISRRWGHKSGPFPPPAPSPPVFPGGICPPPFPGCVVLEPTVDLSGSSGPHGQKPEQI